MAHISLGKLLTQLWGAYSRSLQRFPLPTKVVTAVTIFTTSDLSTQYLTRDVSSAKGMDSFSFNYWRAFSASSFGVIGTVYVHYWWNFLELFMNVRFPVTSATRQAKLVNTLAKVSVDQSLSAPFYNWCYFLITNYVHSGQDSLTITARTEAAATKATEMIGPLMMQHWRIWPMVHFLNFYFTPIQYRLLVQNLLLSGWAGYLSHLNHSTDVVRNVNVGTSTVTRLRRRKTSITGIDVVEEVIEI